MARTYTLGYISHRDGGMSGYGLGLTQGPATADILLQVALTLSSPGISAIQLASFLMIYCFHDLGIPLAVLSSAKLFQLVNS